MKQLLEQMERFWCETMHDELMWPVGSHYRCRVCHRDYPVPFAASNFGGGKPDGKRQKEMVAVRTAAAA
jgi:hypothetical protein